MPGLLIFFAVGLVFAVLIGAVLISSGRPFFSRRGGRRHGWRYWAFFLLKTPLVLASVAVCRTELASTVTIGSWSNPLPDPVSTELFTK